MDNFAKFIGVSICCGCAFMIGGPLAIVVVGIILAFATK